MHNKMLGLNADLALVSYTLCLVKIIAKKYFNLFQFHLLSIDFVLKLISFNTEGFDFLSFSFSF